MLFGINIKGIGSAIVFCLYLSFSLPGLSYSQDIHGDVFVIDDSTYSAVTESNGINEDFSFDFDQTPLKEALRQIAFRANLTLSYWSDLLDDKILISASGRNIKINEAMKRVLRDTEFEFEVTDTRHLVIFNKKNIGNVTGKVVDATTGELMQNARVYLIEKNDEKTDSKPDIKKGTFVDFTGKFDINNVEVGRYQLLVIFQGYKRAIRDIEIRNNQTAVSNFQLQSNG